MKSLISLREHNQQIIESVPDPQLDVALPNGVACPTCGNELLDTHPNLILNYKPPQKHIKCSKCAFRGVRLA